MATRMVGERQERAYQEAASMLVHTPGPWRIGDAGHTVFGPKTGAPVPAIVASDLTRANARLIAAAPALLEACKRVLAHPNLKGELPDDVVAQLRAAIDQAEGAA